MNIAYLQPGNIAYIEPDTHVGEWIKKYQRLDCYPGFFERLAPYIRPGDTVVDAGAYIGDHTVAYLRMAQGGTVIAFEPNPMPFECLVHNVPHAIGIRAGLSSKHGIMVLTQEANVASAWGQQLWYTEHRSDPTAPTIALDDIALHHLNFLKIDIEGFEVMALQGARKTLARHRPTMFIEVNCEALARQGSTREGLLAAIEGLGYRWEPWHYDGEKWRDNPDPKTCELFDVLCVPV